MLQWKESESGLSVKPGYLLCRKLQQAQSGSIHLAESSRKNTGYFVVIEVPDADPTFKPGDIVLGLSIAGSPLIMPDGTSFYYINADAEVISSVKPESPLWQVIQRTYKVVKIVGEE